MAPDGGLTGDIKETTEKLFAKFKIKYNCWNTIRYSIIRNMLFKKA